MKTTPAETPQWREKFDRGAPLAGNGVGRVRIFKECGHWWYVGESVQPDRFEGRKRWLTP